MDMKQIISIENLQDEIALGKEIYVVDHYMNDKYEMVFLKNFVLWNNIRDRKTVSDWIKTKTLFSSEPINLTIV